MNAMNPYVKFKECKKVSTTNTVNENMEALLRTLHCGTDESYE